jgi:hypothetical protein
MAKMNGVYRGVSLAETLGCSPESANPEDVLRLSKRQVMQVFYAAECPAFGELKGEYHGQNHPAGFISVFAGLYLNHFFGPGRWTGKAFFPFEATRGWGYNLFTQSPAAGQSRIIRAVKIATSIGASIFDGKSSFMLDYSAHNRGVLSYVRDELRKINNELFIGVGHLGMRGGTLFPSPFIISGAPKEWVGC